jgi:hypothetical protein
MKKKPEAKNFVILSLSIISENKNAIARINETNTMEPQMYEKDKLGFSFCQKQGRRFHNKDVCIVNINEIEVSHLLPPCLRLYWCTCFKYKC